MSLDLPSFPETIKEAAIFSSLRKLTPYEQFFNLSNQKKPFTICSIIEFDGILSPMVLRKALDTLQKRHELLRVKIINEPFPRFIKLEKHPISLRIIDLSKNNKNFDYQKTIDNELHYNFINFFGTHIKTTLISEKTSGKLLITIDHTIVDGISLASLISELFEIIELLSLKKNIEGGRSERKYIPLDYLIPTEFPNRFSAISFNHTISEHAERKKTHSETSSGTSFKLVSFSVSETSVVLKACKKRKTSLQSALLTAMGLSCRTKLVSPQEEHELPILLHFPVNLRPLLEVPPMPRSLGCYIGLVSIQQLFNTKGRFWDYSINIHKEIKKRLTTSLPIDTVLDISKSLNNCTSYEDFLHARKINFPLAGVSNLGIVNLKNTYSDIKIKALYFPLAMHGLIQRGDNIYITVSTHLDRLFFSFLSPKGKYSGSILDHFSIHFKKILLKHCEER